MPQHPTLEFCPGFPEQGDYAPMRGNCMQRSRNRKFLPPSDFEEFEKRIRLTHRVWVALRQCGADPELDIFIV